MLNQDIDLATQPALVRHAFLGTPRRTLLVAGHKLFKFSHDPLFKPDGGVSPWWSSVEPLEDGDPGLEQTLARAARLGVPAADFARARSAVTRQWNKMSGLLLVRLLTPVFGLAGRCASQRYDEGSEFANVMWIGGAWQLYIPNLTPREVAIDTSGA